MSTETPSTVFTVGSTIQIEFQQNANHWYSKIPGWMDAAIACNPDPQTDSEFTFIGNRIPDFEANSMLFQTNFTITARLPSVPCAHAVIRVRYVSNNPDEVVPNNPIAAFYQCADIVIAAATDKHAVQA